MSSLRDDIEEFEESRINHHLYPSNVVRKQSFLYTLERYRRCLQQEGLFHRTERRLFLIDLAPVHEGSQELKLWSTDIDTSEALTANLSKPYHPRWRFVSLQSLSSRASLGCTKDQLTTILSYHQVMPSFVDLIMAFKPRSRPITHAIFRHESYVQQDSPQFALPEYGRSGVQIQIAFNLLSVERTDVPNELNQWPLRQTAVFHSFDVVSGQTMFMVLKADTTVMSRMAQEVSKNREIQPSALLVREKSFAATLLMHLVMVEWCTENWPEYIDDFEQKVRDKSTEGRMAPISAATSPTAIEMTMSRRSTRTSAVASRMSISATRSNTLSRDSTTAMKQPPQLSATIPETEGTVVDSQSASPSSPRGPIRRQSSGLRQSVADLYSKISNPAGKRPERIDVENALRGNQEHNGLDFDLDESLSFDEFQRMNRWSEELTQSLTAIEQNKGVLKELGDHYREVLGSQGFTQNMKTQDVSSSLARFFNRIDGAIRDLSVNQDRLRAIAYTLDNDKALYGAALQYQSAKVSEHFAQTARESAVRMEDWTMQMHEIAIKTGHETVSMHVITVFTLIFLPGTFVAVRYGWPYLRQFLTAALTQIQTFFSSGAIQWDEDGTLGTDYIARPAGIKLFFVTMLPLTVIIMVIWALIYRVTRKHRKNESEDILPRTKQ